MYHFYIWLAMVAIATIIFSILGYKYNEKYPIWGVFLIFVILLLSVIPNGTFMSNNAVERIATGKAVIEVDRIETNSKGDTLNITYKLVTVKK